MDSESKNPYVLSSGEKGARMIRLGGNEGVHDVLPSVVPRLPDNTPLHSETP